MKKKGFAGILFILVILFTAAILVGMNNQTKTMHSHKELLPQIKTYISNFDVTLNLIAQDYNSQIDPDFNQMIKNGTAKFLSQNQLPFFFCNTTNQRIIDENTIKTDLNCIGPIIQQNEPIKIQVIKTITIKKS